ncbi:WhiB family transcriptional regulator [Streptosporangium sandarakinum]|uniref:WhiB family transcriptional regulator n=1 Tax=Streptosporangium sandarakinum TaxID=1260955 RepID=UPI0036BEB534
MSTCREIAPLWLPPGTASTWVCQCGGINPCTETTCQRCDPMTTPSVLPSLPATDVPAGPLNLADAWSVLAEAGECRYDRDLHAGPNHPEGAHERAARVQVAREVCGPCPVRALCLAYALTVRPATGVWAACTAEEIGHLADTLPELAEVA